MRDPVQIAALATHGKQIAVLELEGPVFFGTSETLNKRLETLASGSARYIVLDLKRVNEMDSSGARVILPGYDRLVKAGKQLVLSGAADHAEVGGMLRDSGVNTALGTGHLFADADAALEWAEERVLAALPGFGATEGDFQLRHFEALAGMTDAEIAIMQTVLERRTWKRGDVVFRQGDTGDELFLIAQGAASVRIHIPGENRSMRLVTFSPGTLFGELALLDREARSATVEADSDLVCQVMSFENFTRLSSEHPALAIKLITNLGRELSGRLRRANRTIYQLEG